MSDGCTQNWPEVEERLRFIREAYTGLQFISNLVGRWDSGERTREIAEDIMAVGL